MATADTGNSSSLGVPMTFQTTHWSVVLTAGQDGDTKASTALERLCQTYWFPIYTYLRRQNREREDAQDLTQGFFEHLLQNQRLQTVRPHKGKFRSFLLASLKNFLANEWDKRRALKRGGEFAFVSLDEEVAESRFRREPYHEATPEKAFEQSWALTLLDSVLAQLRRDYVSADKTALFEAIQVYLSGDNDAAPYAETAARMNLTESALKMSVLRLRRRFGELLRAEISQTVTRPEELDEEIRALFAAVHR
jgi:RNA polymerase sigma factor (sigma-70 family)